MEDYILKYDKDVAIKTGAMSYKLYIFMLWVFALLVFISSAVFEAICYFKGIATPIMTKYTVQIIYFSLFILFVWIFTFPVWYPAHVAENLAFVKKGNKFYKIRNKKDNFLDREKHLENVEYFNKIVANLPKEDSNAIIEEYEFVSVLRKTKRYAVVQVKENNKTKTFRVYNIYDNFEKLN